MSDVAPSLPALQSCIQQETDVIQAFIALLQREADILAGGAENDALAAITQEKSRYADQLAAIANQRNGILAGMGYGTDKNGLETAVATHPMLSELVQDLLNHIAQASMLNTGNGRIITRFLNNNQEALDALQHLTGRSNLYDASGRTRPTTRQPATHIKAG